MMFQIPSSREEYCRKKEKVVREGFPRRAHLRVGDKEEDAK